MPKIYSFHILLILLLSVALLQFNMGCGLTGSSSTPVPGGDPSLNYTVYPDTSAAPVLRFYWGAAKQTVAPSTLSSIGKYGEWEGSGGASVFKPGFEPASEIEIRLTSTREPVYSYSAGTIVYLNTGSPNLYGQNVGTLSVRYGKHYIIKYLHLTEIQSGLALEGTIEKGTLLGYTEKMGASDGFWEIEMDVIKDSSHLRAVPPVPYFDTDSRTVFDEILSTMGETSWTVPVSAPTTEGWVSYVGTHETWADPAKCGVKNTSAFESLETFLDAYGLSWVLN